MADIGYALSRGVLVLFIDDLMADTSGYSLVPMGGVLIGYARVSTTEQETRVQLDALRRAGVRRVFHEKTSGVGPRPQLQQALASMVAGDVLVVWKLDRLARGLKDLLQLLEALQHMGCSFRSLTEPVDTTSALGELVVQILGAVAQFERRLIWERCEAGRRAAMERGVVFGRTPLLDESAAVVAAVLYRDGFSLSELASMFDVSYTAVRAALVRRGVRLRRPGSSPGVVSKVQH